MGTEKEAVSFVDKKVIIGGTSVYSPTGGVARRGISEAHYRKDDEEVRGSWCD